MIDGAAIKRARKHMGMSQPELAKYFRCSVNTVSRWECGVCKPSGAVQIIIEKILEDREATDV